MSQDHEDFERVQSEEHASFDKADEDAASEVDESKQGVLAGERASLLN